MLSSGKEVVWRDTLRSSKVSKSDSNILCGKFKRSSLKASILSELDPKKLAQIYDPRSGLTDKDMHRKNKQYLNNNLVRMGETFQSLGSSYQEIITKQEEEIAFLNAENKRFSKQLAQINAINERSFSNSEKTNTIVKDSDDVINYYQNAIQAAKDLLEKEKSEFMVIIDKLLKEKSRLNRELELQSN